MFVTVAIPIPALQNFTYAVPEALSPLAAVGRRVLVPFGRRRLTGFIVGTAAEAGCDQALREILRFPDPEPLFDAADLAFYTWISAHYLHPLGKVLSEIIPGGSGSRSDRWLRLGETGVKTDRPLSAGQKALLECVSGCRGSISLSRLRRTMAKNDLYADLHVLEAAGLIHSEERLSRAAVRPRSERWIGLHPGLPPDLHLSPKQSRLVGLLRERGELRTGDLPAELKSASATVKTLKDKGVIRLYEKEVVRAPARSPEVGPNGKPITLNAAQTEALAAIRTSLAANRFSPCLLHGVTGSGKTEVYFRAITEVLGDGGGVIYLVPEIALTAQLLTRIRDRFPEQEIAVVHSGVARGARYDQWRRILRGELRVVVGARSALFAPVRNLRLIVVDEEHDPSYKQDGRLRYNARDLALVRGQLAKATVILGSATPAVQSYYHATAGRYRYLSLPARIDDHPLPRVDVIDLRTERDEAGRTPLLSRALLDAIGETLAGGNQTLLFLNRRGFHTYLFCPECGHVFSCPNCDLALTHHSAAGVLKCHHCDFTSAAADRCPACQGTVRSYGAGTERVEQEVRRRFPAARVVRMDSDTTARRGESESILRALGNREIDILVGTQMITKGHDFPGITLVGVVAADASLNIPDFRAAERTFQILTQVSGRSGRGEAPGRVFIQTFNPDHYTIRLAKEHDYAGFFAAELPLRRALGYPPFSRLVGLHFSCLSREEGKKAAREVGDRARTLAAALAPGKVDVIGPAESPLARIRGRYRWQLLLRGSENRTLLMLTRQLLEGTGRTGLDIQADVDPVNFM